ncbi:MAG TPA: metalloregulator ArsR/SmtB family transcription factor [Gemmatimonadaceae bacterium]|nr:metalloregulator ArsR/SmtB family transcription factor [Gemmatimonadaceae bacterium]
MRFDPDGHVPSPEALVLVARRFRLLAEPARLRVLHALSEGASAVTDLALRCGMSVGMLSRHLQVLHDGGFVRRRRDGVRVIYALADAQILELCDLMCGRLASELAVVRGAFAGE